MGLLRFSDPFVSRDDLYCIFAFQHFGSIMHRIDV